MYMRPKEKILSAIRGDPLDSPPALPLIGVHSALLAGVNPRKAFSCGKLMAELQIKALNFYKPDGIFHYMDLTLEAEALGAKVEFKRYTPVIVGHCAPEVIDFEVDRGRIREFIEATRILYDRVSDKYFIGAYITGPLTLAMELIGFKEIIKHFMRERHTIIGMFSKLTEFLQNYAKELIDAGANGIMILEPCCALVSPKLFKQLIPYLNKLCESILRHEAHPFLHICGDARHLLEIFPEVKASVFHIDYTVSLRKARRKLGDRCIMGNISTSLLLTCKEAKIKKIAMKCIEEAGTHYYILSTGCEIPPQTPPNNVKALIMATRT